MKVKKNTIDYYNKNYQKLIQEYDNAKVTELYNLYKKYIKNDSFVLDIGFGSGRDLNFIKNITNNVFGLDGSIEFVNNLKKYIFFKDRVSLTQLPNIDTSHFKIDKFDVIISIAVFMHFDKVDILQIIENFKKILKKDGIIIISYSTKSRNNDERDFYEISYEEMKTLFVNHNFEEIEFIVNRDNLKRDIEWVTQVFKLKI